MCEVYKLHRETYYLALDFIDRYLSIKHDIAKQRLQLVGTTALFIAAKIEVRLDACLKCSSRPHSDMITQEKDL